MYPVQLVRNESVIAYPVVQAGLSQRYTDLTIDFIKRNKDRPFFVYLPHAMPHKPLAASDNFFTPETPDNLYADVIAELDHCVGQVLDAVKAEGLDENTLVVFTSDNGATLGGCNGNLRGMKGRTWDGGMKVPFIARMPGTIPAGTVNRNPAATVDMLPTLCSLVGIDPPDDRKIDGLDIFPMLNDSTAPSPHQAIFGMRGEELAWIRSGKWKLHVLDPGRSTMRELTPLEAYHWVDPRGPDGVTIIAPVEQGKAYQIPGRVTGAAPKPMMLFDIEQDPGEQHDVADQHPDVVKRLKRLFDRTEAEVPDFPAPKADYQFADPAPGEQRVLMRLIGGELRYDRIPTHQKHLIVR